jgi:uncharacterized glyoxalase superfamily protein PhnB
MKPNLNVIGIVTADMNGSLDFYRLLGLDAPRFEPEEDHFQCDLGNGVSMMWDTVELVKQFMPEYRHGDGGSIGLAFQCGSPDEVDGLHTKVIAAGFKSQTAPWDAFWGQRYAIVKDPDGNAISLYAPLK